MPSKPLKLSDKAALPFKSSNKIRRQNLHIKQKRARDSLRRADRFSRKKEESKNPRLREERLRRNVPQTLDRKRVWDEFHADDLDHPALGRSIDVEHLKRRKLEEEQALSEDELLDLDSNDQGALDDEDHDSMLDEDEDDEHSNGESIARIQSVSNLGEDHMSQDLLPEAADLPSRTTRLASPTRSTTSTNLALAPEALAAKFPSLFPSSAPPDPKILITTSLNSTLHDEARLLTQLFPNSAYIPRSAHRYGHKFSVREISSFAAVREFTSVIVLTETQKQPTGLTIVHLPQGPTFHFTITNWYSGTQIPNHGKATRHIPELILNNFRTPLGLLTAHLFRTLFPARPDLEGRQVVTLHNQRDYIFLRRHRYLFRDRRDTERAVTDPATGKEIKGAEAIRAGLQELGPRLTLKLRRVDKGIQRSSGQEWEWQGKMEKVRTKFQL